MKSSFFKPYRMGFLKVTYTWNRTCEDTLPIKIAGDEQEYDSGLRSTALMQMRLLTPTLASGAPRPGSWMMSVTTPLMYPFLSAWSSVRC